MAGRNYCLLAIALIIFLQACAPAAPAPAPVAPVDINAIVAQTANAAASMTAVFYSPVPTATFTPPPTKTPTEISTSTPTFIFVLATNTVPTPIPSNTDFACGILSKKPSDNASFSAGASFEMRWTVQNTGEKKWNSDNADYRFSSGASLHTQDIYDLPTSVAVGDQIDIIVSMKAPAGAGSYTTTWIIKSGQIEFCPMSVTIVVK